MHSLIIELLNANLSNYSFLKKVRYVCSEKRPYLSNGGNFIRLDIAMNKFRVFIKAFSRCLLIFTND